MNSSDDYSTFKKVFETPITRSRQPGCSEKDMELGEARSAQVIRIFHPFFSMPLMFCS